MDPILAFFVDDARDRLRQHKARLPQESHAMTPLAEEVLADLASAVELVSLLSYELQKARAGSWRGLLDPEAVGPTAA